MGRKNHRMLSEGLLHERAIESMYLDLVVVEPAAKPPDRALTIAGSTDNKRRPSAQANRTGVDQTHHHPGQGLEVTKVQPISMLTEHLNQRIIQVGRVLHNDPP